MQPAHQTAMLNIYAMFDIFNFVSCVHVLILVSTQNMPRSMLTVFVYTAL